MVEISFFHMFNNQEKDGQKSLPKIRKENLKHECTLALCMVADKETDPTNKTLQNSIHLMIGKASKFL